MNFAEAFEELNQLNEEILTEKKWVAIRPKNSNNYYKFLTVEDDTKIAADVADMLTVKRGTYKQSIYKDVLAELIDELKKASGSDKVAEYTAPANYEIEKDISNINNATQVKTLTRTDRALRRKAHKDVNCALNNNATAKQDLENKLQGRKYLIHHENNNEDDNKLNNLIFVPYFQNDKADLRVANGVHSLLHAIAEKNAKTFSINYNTDIYYFDDQGKLQVGTFDIVVNPRK